MKESKIFLFIIAFILVVSSLNAQYFGRNKVQYETFDFKVMHTEHFTIYFYPQEEEAAMIAARMAERWYSRYSRLLNHALRGSQPIILYSSTTHFQQTTAVPGFLGEGTGGVTLSTHRQIVLPLGASLAETDHVIGHELVHAFQFDITGQDHPTEIIGSPSALNLPLWFMEGMAEYLSLGPVDPNTAMWMRDALYRKDLPSIKKLENSKYFPYRYGQALWAYITGKEGDAQVGKILNGVGKRGSLKAVIERSTGKSMDQLSKDWHNAIEKEYGPLLQETQVTEKNSKLLFKETEQNKLNVSPALSPDGKMISFLSSKDLFSIDLYLANGETGKIKRRLTKTAVDPHFQSLEFISSSGSWDPQNRLFAFGSVSNGQPTLTILDVGKDKIQKEKAFPKLGEILNPTWSPDGRHIAFSAQMHGLTDLFIYDLEADKLDQVTKDPYADLLPAWSPDGRYIAFMTDRFSTDLSILSIGNYEIALYEPSTGKFQKVQGFTNAKNINPQWSADSKSLYFISDQNGISNIYRKNLETQEIFQVTNIFSGISGITALSPAFSVAKDTGSIAYCMYTDSGYSIYTIESKNGEEGEAKITEFGNIKPAVLPPQEGRQSELIALLENPLFGLQTEKSYKFTDYRAKLRLDYVSPPQLGVGVDQFGTYVGGGVGLVWSDLLGYYDLTTAVQTSSRLKDTAAMVSFLNDKHRLNWGLVAERIPYITGGFATGYGTVSGEPVEIDQEYIFAEYDYQLGGIVAYPFNPFRRFEISAGYQYSDFSSDIRTRSYSLFDGTLIDDSTQHLPAPDSLHFAYISPALVYDSSFFGATSPLLGQSYRLQVSPQIGNISFYTVLADYRRYFMPVQPFTLAFRILHYGRYGKNAEDQRLYPLFIGYDTLVRGYNTGSFSAQEVSSDNGDLFNRLLGSKIIVANAELRFPLFKVLGVGRGFYGILPIEFLTFFDAGLAWSSEDKAWFLEGGQRKPVYSTGIGLRMNLFGYVIAGVNFVHPFNRPYKKGWYFEFSFQPGF